MSVNLCEDCLRFPCGNNSPIGIPGYATTVCKNQTPGATALIAKKDAEIAALREERDKLLEVTT